MSILELSSKYLGSSHRSERNTESSSRLSFSQQKKLKRIPKYSNVPSIDPVSRLMAEMQMDDLELPFMVISSFQEEPIKKPLNKKLLIKNSLKRFNGDLPVKLDLKLDRSKFTLSVSNYIATEPTREEGKDYSEHKAMKSKMDSYKSRIKNKAQYKYGGGDIYRRSLEWKKNLKEKVEKLAEVKRKSEESSCPFKPAFACKERKEAPPRRVKSYAELSPTKSAIGFSTGLNMGDFQKKVKPLVNYK